MSKMVEKNYIKALLHVASSGRVRRVCVRAGGYARVSLYRLHLVSESGKCGKREAAGGDRRYSVLI